MSETWSVFLDIPVIYRTEYTEMIPVLAFNVSYYKKTSAQLGLNLSNLDYST